MLFQSLGWLLLVALLVCCSGAGAWPIFGRKRDSLLDATEEGHELQEGQHEIAAPLPSGEHGLDQLMEQVVNLNERLASFDAKRLVLVETNAQLTIQLKGRTTELYHARAELGARKDELARALAKQHQLESQSLGQQQKFDEGADAVRTMESRFASQTLELEALQRRLAELEQQHAELEQLHDAQGAELAAQQHKSRELEARAREESDSRQRAEHARIAADSAREHDLEHELEQASVRITELENHLARRDEELRIYACASDALQLELAEKAAQHEALCAHCSGLEAQLAARQGEVSEGTGRSDELSRRCSELEAQLHEREAELREHEAELREREGELQRRTEQQQLTESGARTREQELFARLGELQGHLARRDEELGQRSTELETLQGALADHTARADELSRRCAELAQQLQQQAEHERAFEQRARDEAHELELRAREEAQELQARSGGLQEQLARREQELGDRAASLENLQRELGEQRGRNAELSQRCGELEQELRQLAEHAREFEGHASERELALRARLSELEEHAAHCDDELRKRSAAFEGLLSALTDRTGRCDELARHGVELDGALAARENELHQLRSERARLCENQEALALTLSESQAALASTLAADAAEACRYEQDLADAHARIDALQSELATRAAELHADLAPIEELVESRITSLLDPRAGHASASPVRAYLAGLDERDLELAVRGLFGGAEPLSTSAMERLGARWTSEHAAWRNEPIEGEIVYLWADAAQVKAGLPAEEDSLLVIVAGFVDGSRRVVAVEAGARDSADAWLAALKSLTARGMQVPRLVVGEDGLGLWSALEALGWSCAQQRCWDRRIEHVIESLPKRQRRRAALLLRGISKAETRARAQRLRDEFVKRYRARRPEAVARLQADWDGLVGLYAFPSDHWSHLRTTAVIGSLLDSLRLRTSLSKPAAHTPHAEALLWKFLLAGAKSLRKLNSPQLLPAVAAAESCVDGVLRGTTRGRAA